MTLERSNEIRALCEQLTTLVGKDCMGWHRAWLQADPKYRDQIERTLLLRIEDSQAATDRQPWLAPIPQELADGEFDVGHVLVQGEPRHAFKLSRTHLMRHVTIFGQSGSGKTNMTFLLVQQLLRADIPVLILDWKRNYRDLKQLPEGKGVTVFTVSRDAMPFRFNPLIPPPHTDPRTWLKLVSEVIGHAYYVGEGVASILHAAIDDTYRHFGVYTEARPERWPTFQEVRGQVEENVANASFKEIKPQWAASTTRTMQALCFGDTAGIFNTPFPIPVEALLERSVVLELEGLSENDKTFLVESLILWIHHFRLAERTREKLKHVIVIEEAHHVLRREQPTAQEHILDIVLREIRELGEGIVMIDQSPAQFSQNAIANSATSLVFALKDKADTATAGNFLLLDRDRRDLLNQLAVGQCVVKLQDSHRLPFIIGLPRVPITKGATSDHELEKQSFPGFFKGRAWIEQVMAWADERLKTLREHPAHAEFLGGVLEGEAEPAWPESGDDGMGAPTSSATENPGRSRHEQNSSAPRSSADNLGDCASREPADKPAVTTPSSAEKNRGRPEAEHETPRPGSSGHDSRDSTSSDKVQPVPGNPEKILADRSAPKNGNGLKGIDSTLLYDIATRPSGGAGQRYRRLKISVRRGTEARRRLEIAGYIMATEVKTGEGRMVLLSLTKKGETTVRRLFPHAEELRRLRNGPTHRYWKDRIASSLAHEGYAVEQEKPLNGERVDVHAQNGERIAVEVETHGRRMKKNITKALRAGYDKVIVVPTSERALRKALRLRKKAPKWGARKGQNV